jgi:hypothetical protein
MDYIQIVFTDSSRLTIFNRCRWIEGALEDLPGLRVTNMQSDEKIFRFVFNDVITLEFDAKPDYEGPEVLTFSRPGMPLIVVND